MSARRNRERKTLLFSVLWFIARGLGQIVFISAIRFSAEPKVLRYHSETRWKLLLQSEGNENNSEVHLVFCIHLDSSQALSPPQAHALCCCLDRESLKLQKVLENDWSVSRFQMYDLGHFCLLGCIWLLSPEFGCHLSLGWDQQCQGPWQAAP